MGGNTPSFWREKQFRFTGWGGSGVSLGALGISCRTHPLAAIAGSFSVRTSSPRMPSLDFSGLPRPLAFLGAAVILLGVLMAWEVELLNLQSAGFMHWWTWRVTSCHLKPSTRPVRQVEQTSFTLGKLSPGAADLTRVGSEGVWWARRLGGLESQNLAFESEFCPRTTCVYLTLQQRLTLTC